MSELIILYFPGLYDNVDTRHQNIKEVFFLQLVIAIQSSIVVDYVLIKFDLVLQICHNVHELFVDVDVDIVQDILLIVVVVILVQIHQICKYNKPFFYDKTFLTITNQPKQSCQINYFLTFLFAQFIPVQTTFAYRYQYFHKINKIL